MVMIASGEKDSYSAFTLLVSRLETGAKKDSNGEYPMGLLLKQE